MAVKRTGWDLTVRRELHYMLLYIGSTPSFATVTGWGVVDPN